jgi:NADPH:quinone reductase-like Zn-dependent oxidoreductase
MGGIGSHTAIYALEKLGLPRWDKPATEPSPILIWSGATSVGHYAVQLAKVDTLDQSKYLCP